jgi:Putative Ig domain
MPLGTPYIPAVVPTATGNQVSNKPVSEAESDFSGRSFTPVSNFAFQRNGVTVQVHEGVPHVTDAELVRELDRLNPVAVGEAIANQDATEDEAFEFVVPADSFVDPDVSSFGASLVWSATLDNDDPLPDWLSFDAETRTFSGTPLTADVGTITVKVTVTSTAGAIASQEFDIVVAGA